MLRWEIPTRLRDEGRETDPVRCEGRRGEEQCGYGKKCKVQGERGKKFQIACNRD